MKKLLLLTLVFFTYTISFGQKLPFQGYLEESGAAVNGQRNFTFEIADFSWTETFSNVEVNKGIYSVVLGESNPLPANLFDELSEVTMQISLDTTNLGTVMLYKPLGLNSSQLAVKNDGGDLRALLDVDASDVGRLTLRGANDSLNLRLNSTGGYYGNIGIFDSLGVSNGFMRARSAGGFLQLNKLDSAGNFASAVVASAGNATSGLTFFAQNPSANGVSSMILNYTTGLEVFNGPAMSNNYKRSGTDWYDNEGRILAAIGNAREEAADPEGGSGYLSLWGKNSFNIQLAGKRWQDNDFPTFELFGRNDDGGTWWMRNYYVDIQPGAGTRSYTNMGLLNTDNGGESNETVFLTSSLDGNLSGYIEVRDSLGNGHIRLEGRNGIGIFNNASIGSSTNGILHLYGETLAGDNLRTQIEVRPDGSGSSYGFVELRDPDFNSTIILDGSNGNINSGSRVSVNRLDGSSAVNIYQFENDGGISIQDAADNGRLFFSGTEGNLILRDEANLETVRIESQSANLILPGVQAGRFNGENGLIYAKGENNTAGDDIRVGLEVISDGFGSSNGRLFVKDSTSTDVITLEGNSGVITAVALNQTSDLRLKTNIQPLENSLSNTLQLQGRSYDWRNQTKASKKQIGLIAQEVELIYPEFVHTDKAGMKSVNYAQLTAVLIEAIKELNAKVDKLEKEKGELSAALEETKDLSDRIAKIEKILLQQSEVASN